MISSYEGSLDLGTFVTSASIALINRIKNKEGQVYIIDSAASPENFLLYPIDPYGITFI